MGRRARSEAGGEAVGGRRGGSAWWSSVRPWLELGCLSRSEEESDEKPGGQTPELSSCAEQSTLLSGQLCAACRAT